jgi:hypothetical protein
MRLRLEVGTVVVRAQGERHKVDRVAPAVEEAFRQLAALLERTPAGRFGDVQERVIASLDTGALPLDELLSPRGAERLANEWYRRLMESERG